MSVRLLMYLLYYALLIPVLLTMFACYNYLSSSPEMLRRSYPLKDWPPNKSRNLSQFILPNNETLLMQPQNINCSEKIFLLIVVFSRVQSVAVRKAIRQTWANTTDFNYQHFAPQHAHMQGMYLDVLLERIIYYKDYIKTDEGHLNMSIRVVFLVGRNASATQQKQLHVEQRQYNDILQQDFIDTYYNLTIKSVMLLKWLAHNCMQQNIAFVMKCDEDVFVNVPNLLHFLLGGTIPVYNSTIAMHTPSTLDVLAEQNRFKLTKKVLAGFKFCQTTNRLNASDKLYVPFYLYEGLIYPPYISGISYIMSGDVIPNLYKMALQTPLHPLEDIFLTGICAERLKLPRYHNSLFTYNGYSYLPHRLCALRGCITMHWESKYLIGMYHFVKSADIKCVPPDWNFKMSVLTGELCEP